MTDEIGPTLDDARRMLDSLGIGGDDNEATKMMNWAQSFVEDYRRAQAASTREKVEKEIAGWLRTEADTDEFVARSADDSAGWARYATRMKPYREAADAIDSGAYRQDKPKEE